MRQPTPASLLHTARRQRRDDDILATPPPPCTALPYADSGSATDPLVAAAVASEPIILHGATRRWRAAHRWRSLDALVENYGDVRFPNAMGRSDDSVTLSEFVDYMRSDSHKSCDFPYYLVETNFEGARAVLLDDYHPPPALADNLADVPGTSSKPHWLLGGSRTGSLLHTDTRCACGWNACLFGRKRWLLLPPATDVSALGLLPYSGGPAGWLEDHLDSLQTLSATGGLTGMRECIQEAGDLVFIPAGWHHCVVNLTASCAIAQTLITPSALPAAWHHLCQRWPAFSASLLEMLRQSRPSLAETLAETLPSLPPSAEASSAVRLELAWRDVRAQPPSPPRSSLYVLFVDAAWVRARLQDKPSAEAVLSGRASVAALWAYHEALGALACAVRSRHALLCLVADVPDDVDAAVPVPVNDHDQLLAALRAHGLNVAATVANGSEDAWAVARASTCGGGGDEGGDGGGGGGVASHVAVAALHDGRRAC